MLAGCASWSRGSANIKINGLSLTTWLEVSVSWQLLCFISHSLSTAVSFEKLSHLRVKAMAVPHFVAAKLVGKKGALVVAVKNWDRDFWTIYQWSPSARQALSKVQTFWQMSEKTVRHYVPLRVFFLLPGMLPRRQIGVDIFPQCATSSTTLPTESRCHPRILGRGPHCSDVNILLLRTWTTHYTHSFPLNGKRRRKLEGGGWGVKRGRQMLSLTHYQPFSLSPSVRMCMFPY